MITSDFTLEYTFSSDTKVPSEASLPRLPIPDQLKRLHVRDEVWTSVYDYATGVVDRAVAREAIKRSLDESLYAVTSNPISLFSKKTDKRDQKKAEIEAAKADHDEATKKGWAVLLRKCNDDLSGYGVTPYLLTDPKTSAEYGIEFRCHAAKLQPNKLELRYDRRRGMWTWPRDKVPDELSALLVDAESWATVWDKAQSTVEKVLALEEQEKINRRHMDQIDSGISVWRGDMFDREAVSRAIVYATKLVDKKYHIKQEQELEWSRLLDFADDTFFMWGISTKLMTHKNTKNLSCLVLRFRPIAPTSVVGY